MEDCKITTVEMHTAGEPLRIVIDGWPEVVGQSILEKLQHVKAEHDHLRRLIMLEPRGHRDMFGALMVAPSSGEADVAVLWLTTEGYSPMCGHGCIALARYAADNAKGREKDGGTTVVIECPCGLIECLVSDSGDVTFTSVYSYAIMTHQQIQTSEHGTVEYHLGYGGAFYAVLKAASLGLDLGTSSDTQIARAAMGIKGSIEKIIKLQNKMPLSGTENSTTITNNNDEVKDIPKELYGILLTDGKEDSREKHGVLSNICIFADGQVDRSPCGSGVTCQLAVMYARGLVQQEDGRIFRNAKTGSEFAGRIIETKGTMVRARVTGKAFYTGTSTFQWEKGDEIGKGFRMI